MHDPTGAPCVDSRGGCLKQQLKDPIPLSSCCLNTTVRTFYSALSFKRQNQDPPPHRWLAVGLSSQVFWPFALALILSVSRQAFWLTPSIATVHTNWAPKAANRP